MPSYRIELSKSNRAICKETECKKNKEKIPKDVIRFGTWLATDNFEGWQWRHWGCVSGAQILSLQETCDQGDGKWEWDAIDGYDELDDSPELQAKVRRVVEQGHIDPEDFNGDPEKNKPGEKGIRLTKKQREKKEKEAAEAAGEGDADEYEKPKKSRKRAKDVDDEIPPTKKSKSSKAVKATKVVKDEDSDEDAAMPAKKSRKASTTKATKAAAHDGDGADTEDVPPAKNRRKSATSSKKSRDDAPMAVTKNSGRKSSGAKVVGSEVTKDLSDDAETAKPPPKAKSKRSSAVKTSSKGDGETEGANGRRRRSARA